MIPKSALKDVLANQEISKRDRLLICLAVDHEQPKQVREVVEIAVSSGMRTAKKWNVSDIFSKSNGFAVRTERGWELSSQGKRHVADVAGPFLNTPVPIIASSLRKHLLQIADSETKNFVEEAICCFESGQHRAAVVLSWVGAISLLQHHVVKHSLISFNQEASRRDKRWKQAKTTDELALIKEDTFLDILQAISVIGKNVKQELKKGLVLRNGCGHPNSLRLAEYKVSAHIEDLILNVFAKFA